MTKLWPPLPVIESNLGELAESEVSSARPTISDSEAMPHTTAVMPDFIQALVARRVAAQSAGFAVAPTAGQVRVSGEIRAADGHTVKRLRKPFAVLLDTKAEGDLWSGWLVTSETDYASYWDMLLDHRDEPFDPLAGMVLIWNPVRCLLPSDSRALAQLSAERMEAVRELARDFNSHATIDDKPRPGFIGARSTSSGVVVLTGTVLGDAHDPRRTYQTLYQRLGQEVTQALQASNVAVLAPRKQSMWMKPALAIAATILLVQGIVIQQLLGPRPPGGSESGDLTRGIPVQLDGVLLDIFFKPTAQEMQIRKLLSQVRGKIVSGPGENGDYQIAIPRDKSEEAIITLSRSEIVDAVAKHKEAN